MRSAAFLLGLLHPATPPYVTAEDLSGPHGEAAARWQALGFIDREPGLHPAPSCPACGEGAPYRVGGRLLCSACRTPVDPRELLAWPVRREAFLAALAARLSLRGGLGVVGDGLWEIGTGVEDGAAVLHFYHPGGPLSDAGRARLAAYRRVLVLHGPLARDASAPGRWQPLLDLLEPDGAFAESDVASLVRPGGAVRFDHETGGLWVGETLAGEVPVGSREWALLWCLAEQLGQFVSYSSLKREVLRRAGGSGGAEEATFCQKLKSRIKARFIPGIDRLIVTTNKADGYRLRAEGGP